MFSGLLARTTQFFKKKKRTIIILNNEYTTIFRYWDYDKFAINDRLFENYSYFTATRTQEAIDFFQTRVNRSIALSGGHTKFHSAILVDCSVSPGQSYKEYHRWIHWHKPTIEQYEDLFGSKEPSKRSENFSSQNQIQVGVKKIEDSFSDLPPKEKKIVEFLKKISYSMAKDVADEYRKEGLKLTL